MPNTPPSSRIMLLIPASLPAVSSVAEPTTEFWAEGIAIEMPTPATMRGATRCENGRPGPAGDAIHAGPPGGGAVGRRRAGAAAAGGAGALWGAATGRPPRA